MAIIYLSPHLDDAALSCGGLIWEQSQQDEAVEIWTIFAGDPPKGKFSNYALEIHRRWQAGNNPIDSRRREDIQSCEVLGVQYRHFQFPDAIYRRHHATEDYLYNSDDKLLGLVNDHEIPLSDSIYKQLKAQISPDDTLVCPLTIGNHVDHQLTRIATEKLGVALAYYLDFPYVEQKDDPIFSLIPPAHKKQTYQISEDAMFAWQNSIAAHQSQISTFWRDEIEMREEIEKYYTNFSGINLYIPEEN